jgi:hypothetical protein
VTRILSCVLFAFSLALIGPSVAHSLEAADVPSAIENAKTAADHEALAAYFEGEAQAARATAERHRRMGSFYEKHPRPAGLKGNRTPLHQTMPPHCTRLVASYEASAEDYEAMAVAHREMAKAVE